jgi:hypothetical protein
MSYAAFLNSQSFKRKSPNLTKLGFNFDNPNSEIEFSKIQSLLSTEYLIRGESMLTIMSRYDIPSARTLHDLFKLVDIDARSLSSATNLAILTCRSIMPSCHTYRTGWHTTWDNKQVFLRSSYELHYAKELDTQQITYEVEAIRVKYYNSEEGKFRIAIPDFLLPTTHTIVEIKSNYSYRPIEMTDKFTEYKKLGYTPILILEGIVTSL